jgi:hypothetical protein
MKCISLWQPHASLIAIGEKTYETRSWYTPYTGPIAIHASKTQNETKALNDRIAVLKAKPELFPEDSGFTRAAYDAFKLWKEREGLASWNLGQLPFGAIVCTAELTGMYQAHLIHQSLTGRVRQFGDFGHGRWAWRLENVRMLKTPMPYRGQQGLWTLPDDVVGQLEAAESVQP